MGCIFINCIASQKMEGENDTPMKKQQSTISNNESPTKKKLSMADFEKLGRLGEGAYGEVYMVRKKDIDKKFALKQLEKKQLAKERKEYQAMVERELLTQINHPGIIKINSSFQDPNRLYFVLELCEGGAFKDFLKLNYGRLSLDVLSFYVGQIVNILEYLHKNGITHRDLKPQNLMLSKNGHIRLIDFGTAEISDCKLIKQQFKDRIEGQKKTKQAYDEEQATMGVERERCRKSTFVGTLYYLSPELLESSICGPASDLWALGCIIYQLYYGKTPFYDKKEFDHDKQEFVVFDKIKKIEYDMPPNSQMPEVAADLIRKLLVRDTTKRLGGSSIPGYTYEDLKKHPFFQGRNIDTLFDSKPPETPDFQQTKGKEKQELEKVKETYERRVTQQIQSKQQKELLIYGVVEKKKFLIYSPIYLMVYKNLEIVMFKPDNPDKKKVLELEPRNPQPAILLGPDKFSLATAEKKYTFRVEEASQWVDQINGELHKKLKK